MVNGLIIIHCNETGLQTCHIGKDHLFARGSKKRRYSSYLNKISPAIPNVINKDF